MAKNIITIVTRADTRKDGETITGAEIDLITVMATMTVMMRGRNRG